MMRHLFAVLFILGALACTTGNPAPDRTAGVRVGRLQGQEPTTNSSEPEQAPVEPVLVRLETVVEGLVAPWSMAWAPDGRIFISERPGRIRVVQEGQLRAEPWARLPAAATGEAGLLGIALDPAFPSRPFLYAYYTYQAPRGGLLNKVVRLREVDGQGAGEETIFDGIEGAGIHDGGRLRFAPDGTLFVTTGDATITARSQDPTSWAGKILRITADGGIPPDNPFPGSPVWSLGHRNAQGLDWHPESGQLVATEHGPIGNDEVNFIHPAGNYGWPLIQGAAGAAGLLGPVLLFNPSVAPSGASFYTGGAIPQWRGDYFFATLVGVHLHRVRFHRSEAELEVAETERLLEGELGRLRDVQTGPDGALYVLTNNRDGRGQPTAGDDRLVRLGP